LIEELKIGISQRDITIEEYLKQISTLEALKKELEIIIDDLKK